MSAFETIGQPAAMPPGTRIEVSVGRRHGFLAALACLVIAGGGFYLGGEHELGRLDAMVAEERRVNEAERARQADALRDVQAASDTRAATAQAETSDLQTRIDAYVAQLQRRPVADRCTLTDADLHGLRDLAPGGAAPRASRRPARAAADAE